MANENDSLLALIGGGLLGYLLGQGQYNNWKPFIEQYQRRLQQVTYTQIPLPLTFLQKSPNIQAIYRQSVFAYLFGLPDSCMPTLIRVLEQALKSKYEEVEKTKPDMDLSKLIDWAESYLKDKTSIAHSFRRLRNFVHTDNLVQEQDCLEGIRHVSIIVENLFPGLINLMNTRCPNCGFSALTSIDNNYKFLGNQLSITCGSCKQNYNWLVMP